jgi:DNA-binding transcriptional ArsR family regulator
MSKGVLALLAFTIALITIVPSTAASQSSGLPPTINPNDLQTKVLQDAKGNVHVLWVVPALNNSNSGPGIWYSKYSANGTDTIAPTRITNSTTIQSADLAVDEAGNALIVWADDTTAAPTVSSAIYLVHYNSTQQQVSRVITRRGSLVLWPSLALGNNDTVYMTWTEYDPANSRARVEYGMLTPTESLATRQLATYERADAFPPQPNLIFDNSSQHIQVAWGESERDGKSASTVSYAKLGTNGTILTQLQVAKFAATLRQVAMTGMDGNDGAFILWQTTGLNNSLYVSQISANGTVAYVKQLNSPSSVQSRYIAISTDSSNNLYVVWYQPSTIAPRNATTSESTGSANMTYVRMSITGVIDQTGSGEFKDPILGVAVLNDGAVYGVSPDGLVSVVTPTEKQTTILPLTAIALMTCVSAAGFAGSLLLEESRYRWVTFYSRMSDRIFEKSTSFDLGTLKLLAKKPGLRLRDLKGSTGAHSSSAMALVAMEKNGYVASFRDGLSRRFYLNGAGVGEIDALRTRILLWVADHPGIWEAQLAKDLGLSQQLVHYHLKKLRESKLVTAGIDENGSRKLYRFADGVSGNRKPN